MIKVLLVDDSAVERDRLRRVLEADPELTVVATADRGDTAVSLAARHRPDVVCMDWQMPGMDGLQATRTIMETDPRPIVLVSESWGEEDFDGVASAFDAGALAGVRKPVEDDDPAYQKLCTEVVRTVRRSAGVKVVRRWPRENGKPVVDTARAAPLPEKRAKVVAIGVSTGGPPVLEAILSRLPANFPAPILVVQHIAEGFVQALIEWLRGVTSLEVRLATSGEVAYGGCVYVAPNGRHLGIGVDGRLVLDASPAEHSHRPSVSYLFRSVADSFGERSVGVLLTGMGSDGARELMELRGLRAVTIAQDRRSCTVFGMPGEAVKLGAAQHVLAPREIGELLCRLGGVSGAPDGSERPRNGRQS